MNGLNLEQVEKVLSNEKNACDICGNHATTVGFKIPNTNKGYDFVFRTWPYLFNEFMDWIKLVDIISHDKNTYKSCKKHRKDLGINIEIDPDQAQNILESIYRGTNGGSAHG